MEQASDRTTREDQDTAGQGSATSSSSPSSSPNVGRAERVASIALGGALAWQALRRRSAVGAGLGALGMALAGRGVTGRCPVYRATGVDTSRLSLPLFRRNGEVVIEQRITVNAPCQQLYERWRELEKLPDVLSHVESVERSEGDRSHWVARGPGGVRVEWVAEITDDRPGERIAWRSVPGSQLENEGEVRFTQAPAGRGTEVAVRIAYRAPAGAALAPALAKLTSSQLREDLRRFKRQVETGEIPSVEGQPRGPARPLFGAKAMRKVRAASEAVAQRSAS